MTVVDASPLIVFAAAGHFTLLQDLLAPIVIPPGVKQEVVVRGLGRPGAQEVGAAMRDRWITVHSVHDEAFMAGLPEGLSRADRECIALAKETSSPLYIDDERAYSAAREGGILAFRTLALLTEAKTAGRLPAVLPIARSLQSAGLRIDAQTFAAWQREIGEEEP